MSRQKLFNQIKSRGIKDVGRNSFDLSNKHAYTSNIARLNPVKCISTYPKDFFNINVNEFSQNISPLNTAAFVDGIKELSAYFVPNNTIWHNFNQFIATREDPDSVLLQERGISYLPRIARRQLLVAAVELWRGYQFITTDTYYDTILSIYGDSKTRSYDASHTYYEQAIANLPSDFSVSAYFSELRNLGMSVDFDSVMRDKRIENLQSTYYKPNVSDAAIRTLKCCAEFDSYENSNSQVLDNVDVYCDMFNHYKWCDWLRKLDMLGYGNSYPYFKRSTDLLLSAFEELLTTEHPADDFETADSLRSAISIGSYVINNIYPILQAHVDNVSYADAAKTQLVYVDIWPLYAYNKIFYDMFRNTYYDLGYNVRNYNVDFLDCSSLAGSVVSFADIPLRFYNLECHQWPKDMFTGVLPDNQLGDISSLTLTFPAVTTTFNGSTTSLSTSGPSYVDGQYPVVAGDTAQSFIPLGFSALGYSDGDPVDVVINHSHDVTVRGSSSAVSSSFDVLALKRAEAIQQYRQDLMRAGNRTRDIFNQIFGASPKSELDESPYFIEAVNNPLNINPVIATAETGASDNGSLGDIAARLTISGKSLSFKFSTEDYGSLIILQYIIPNAFYNSYRIDPCRTLLTQEDLGLPYFQNLGLKPITGELLNNNTNSSARNRILGYAPPYLERKTDIDLCHGNLCDQMFDNYGQYLGSMSHWVVARTDLQLMKAVTLPQFYVNPSIMDSVFKVAVGDDYESDQLLNYCVINVDSVRAFSEIGLPRFV